MGEMSSQDCFEYLNYAVSNGMIDVAKLVTAVEMNKRQELLEKHPYSIWQGNNGKWYTYFPDESLQRKGKLVKKSTREKLEKAIVAFYTESERVPTFGECFRMQQDYMLEHFKITPSTYYRKDNDYTKYIEGSSFEKMQMDRITESDIIRFLDDMLAKFNCQMTRKAFNNVKSLIGNVFVYGKVIKGYKCIYIKELLAGIIPSGRQLKKKQDKLEVFDDAEVDDLIDWIFKNHNDSIRHMGLLFMLFTGVRVGELSVLKLSDFSTQSIHKLHVQRCLTKKKDDNGITQRVIVEYAKTETSEKEILLSDDAIDIYNRILRLREEQGQVSEWFMFENGRRLTISNFDKCIRKLCKEMEIPVRSCHKLRKTYCSELLDVGVSEKVVQDQMRHSDVRTTQSHYNFCIKTTEAKRDAINMVRKLGEYA